MNIQIFTAFLEYLSVVRRFSVHTVSAYRRDISHFLGWIRSGGVPDQYPYQLSHLSSATIRRKMAAIRAFERYCLQVGAASDFGSDRWSTPSMPQKLPFIFPKTHSELFFLAVNDLSERDQFIFRLLYLCGLRISEGVGLRFNDIGFDRGLIRVCGKRGRARYVPVDPGLLSELREFLSKEKLSGSDYIFKSPYRNAPLSTRYVQSQFQKLKSKHPFLKDLTPHSLRHSVATHLIESAATVRDVQAFLGHQQLATTQIYTHLSSLRLREVIASRHPRYMQHE